MCVQNLLLTRVAESGEQIFSVLVLMNYGYLEPKIYGYTDSG
jgi:hypothetical protein